MGKEKKVRGKGTHEAPIHARDAHQMPVPGPLSQEFSDSVI